MFELRPTLCTCITAALSLHTSAMWAQAPEKITAKPHVIAYAVQPGDSLTSVIQGLQLPEHSAQALSRLHTMNPGHSITALRPGQTLQIPENWLRQEAAHVRVNHLSCTGTLLPELSDGRVLAQDQWLAEGSTIKVPAGCKVGLLLQDGSRLQLPSGAVLRLDVLRHQPLHKAPLVQIHLLQGKLGLDIYKQRPARSRFEVQTPKAITGVRGTQFRVGIAPDSQATLIEVLEGKVQAQGEADPQNQTIEKREGLVINAQGQNQGLEALPPPPVLGVAPQANAWAFMPVAQAHAYLIEQLGSANAMATDTPPVTQAPTVVATADRSPQAQLYRAASLTRSGLQGPSATYAMCSHGQHCGVPFDLSEAHGRTKRFELQQVKGSAVQTILNAQVPLNTTHMIATGLAPGRYHWHIEYTEPSPPPQPDHTVRTQGDFILTGQPNVSAP
ncbi:MULTISPECIES: FecR domain-containing protein [unclassified Limnohabitans]|uniref:FecR family protein n=1 Tax=unclassified Limnohabitans TaxID=2626134 RepID=UPI00130493D9|nr:MULTISPECIES: FecR domain-containing protein [unclassified Limnohabitans]